MVPGGTHLGWQACEKSGRSPKSSDYSPTRLLPQTGSPACESLISTRPHLRLLCVFWADRKTSAGHELTPAAPMVSEQPQSPQTCSLVQPFPTPVSPSPTQPRPVHLRLSQPQRPRQICRAKPARMQPTKRDANLRFAIAVSQKAVCEREQNTKGACTSQGI